MDEEKKKKPEEEAEGKADSPETEKAEEKGQSKTQTDEPADKSENKADGNGQNGDSDKPDEGKSDGKSEDKNGSGNAEVKDEDKPDSAAPEQPKLSAEDELRAENLTLKTQLEAMKLGFAPDCMEDAVTLAEAIVKRDGKRSADGTSDIAAALQAVAKKYPDWKSDGKDGEKSKGGFKVGADSSKEKPADSDRLDKAFGIKKKTV
jgi:hypothetical protein